MTKKSIERIENMEIYKNFIIEKDYHRKGSRLIFSKYMGTLSTMEKRIEVLTGYTKKELKEKIDNYYKSNDYENLTPQQILEIDNYVDELEKEYIQQEEELAKMYALNDIERANQ